MKSVRSLLLTALFAALIIVGTFISVPLYPVPVTLQTFFVFLAGLLLPPGSAAGSVAIYLLLGICNLPIFSGAKGGIAVLAGPTGGFLIGMLPAALLGALLADRKPGKKTAVRDILSVVVMEICIYAVGLPMLKHYIAKDWAAVIAAGLSPFVVGDALKMVVSIILARLFRPRIQQFLHPEDED